MREQERQQLLQRLAESDGKVVNGEIVEEGQASDAAEDTD
jgi:hypothetical protein